MELLGLAGLFILIALLAALPLVALLHVGATRRGER